MEVTLYGQAGSAVAYIADDREHSIYLWDGHAVAYLLDEKIYGWNGHHLGWLSGGIAYDTHGYRVGSVKDKCPSVTFVEPIKNIKYVKTVKNVRNVAFTRPSLSLGYSNRSLKDFLEDGRL